MKKVLACSLLFILLIGCSSQDESILKETNEAEAGKSENRVVFGEKTGDQEIDARNVFKLGEPTHFVVHTKNALNVSKVTVVLKKHNGDKWDKLTQAPLEVKPEWKQFMNGLPGSLYKKTGPGAYKLEVLKEGGMVAKGEFIIEKNNKESN